MHPSNHLDLFAALALDALDDAERDAAEQLAAADPDTASELRRYRQAAALIGEAVAATPPADLGSRLATSARAARAAGTPTGPWAAPAITPAEGFGRAMDALDGVLAALSGAEWELPVAEYPGRTVADIVRHLIGVDRIMAGLLGIDDARPAPGAESDHLASTAHLEAALADLDPPALLARWRHHARVLVDHLVGNWPEVDQRSIAMPSLVSLTTGIVATIRIFEVWTHTEDICRATGRPPVAVDASQLLLMCPVAVQAVPFGMFLAGHPARGRTARIVLTGPGGGAWTQAMGLGEEPGRIDVLIVAEAIEFCRLVGQRRTPTELAPHVDGDATLAAALLDAVAMFAA